MAGEESHVHFTIKVDGNEVDQTAFLAFTVERDMFQPDMARVELSHQDSAHADHKIGDTLEILVGEGAGTSIYKGEITGLNPNFQGGGHTTITLVAMNKLHRLLRGRKSKTFADKSDQQILSAILSPYSLTLDWKHDASITYKHVYQNNQTDLEFLRMRAARLGCHVWCVDDKVFVKQPNLGESQKLTLSCSKATAGDEMVKWFRPKLDSSCIVKSVTVRGWDPEKKEEIVGKATASGSPLASKLASANTLGSEETFTVDQPIWSKEEADAIAKARLLDASLSYITGEVEIAGNPAVELGKHIEIKVDGDKPDPFTGKYYVMGLRHVNRVEKNKSAKSGGDGGFNTVLRLARDGQAG